VTYDVRDAKRLRRVHQVMKSYGEWLQYSVFQCRLSPSRNLRMLDELKSEINTREDHILVFPLGPATRRPGIQSIGQAGFHLIRREPRIM